MKLYDELNNAINEIVATMNEHDDFKLQFPKIIENYFEDSYTDSDLNNAIEKIRLVEDNTNGN
jgi:hypothetical protein